MKMNIQIADTIQLKKRKIKKKALMQPEITTGKQQNGYENKKCTLISKHFKSYLKVKNYESKIKSIQQTTMAFNLNLSKLSMKDERFLKK